MQIILDSLKSIKMVQFSRKILFYVSIILLSFQITNTFDLKENVEIVEQQIRELRGAVKDICDYMETVDDDVRDMQNTFTNILQQSKNIQKKSKKLAYGPLDEHKLAEKVVRENTIGEDLRSPKQLGALGNLAPLAESISKFNLTLVANFLQGIPGLLKSIGGIVDASDKYLGAPIDD